MPLKRSEKETSVAAMTEKLGQAQAVILADYRGLNVAQISALRRELRQHGSEIHVIKNSLAKRALEAAGFDVLDDLLVGPTAITFLYEDLSLPVKALLKTAKDTEKLTLKGGLLSGQRIDAKGAAKLAELPSREELLAQFLGLLEAPQRQFLAVLAAPQREFVSVLQARVDAA